MLSMVPTSAGTGLPCVPARSFEGLFLRALEADAALLARLREAGWDPEQPEGIYPLKVWRDCIGIARQRCFGHLADDGEALRALGHAYVRGFAKTIVGKVLAAAAPVLGTERVLSRLPAYLRAGREDSSFELQALAVREWVMVVRDPEPMPDFVIGALTAVMELTSATPVIALRAKEPQRYELLVRW